MDKKKKERKSSPETEQPASNTFTNDGSFLESFKKRMEEYEKQWGNVSKPCPKPEETKSEATKAPEPAVSSNSKPVAATETEVPYYATQTMYYKESDGGQSSKKPQYQVTYLLILLIFLANLPHFVKPVPVALYQGSFEVYSLEAKESCRS